MAVRTQGWDALLSKGEWQKCIKSTKRGLPCVACGRRQWPWLRHFHGLGRCPPPSAPVNFGVRPRVMHPLSISWARQALGLLGWLLLAFAAAAVGGFASAGAEAFYGELVSPSWAPPGWLFGPVWSVLYVLMGIAAWLVWRVRGFAGGKSALLVFVFQLAANALWPWVFFVWHRGCLAFAEILLLWLLIAATIGLFWRISRLSAALLLPYLAWVSFASALTWSLWRLNPGLLG